MPEENAVAAAATGVVAPPPAARQMNPVAQAIVDRVGVPFGLIFAGLAIGYGIGYMHARGVHKRKAARSAEGS